MLIALQATTTQVAARAFDPAAATAAYMASLSPEAHEKATRYTQGGHWLLLWAWLVGLTVALIVIRTGVLVRLTGWLERNRPHRNLAAFLCALAFGAISWVLTLPWSLYADFYRQHQYGLSSQPLTDWFSQGVLGAVIGLVLQAVFLTVLYLLIRRAQRWWWAWGALAGAVLTIVLMLLAPTFIEPLFNRYTPAPPGPTRDAVVALAQKVGVPTGKIYIYNGSRQSNAYTANVSGLGSAARVAMSDTMFQKGADLAEVKGVVGHEMGHYVRQHVWWGAGFTVLMLLAGLFLVDRLFEPAARLLGAKGVDGIADPAGLPVIAAILSTLVLIATPLMTTMSRLEEADADHFSLIHAHEPDGLSKALVKTIEYRASSPSDLEEFLFYDHPSVEHRVRAAMDWKAAHPNEVGQ